MGVIARFWENVGDAAVNVKTSFNTAKGTDRETLSKPSLAMTVAVIGETNAVGTPEKVMLFVLDVTVIPPSKNPVVVKEMG
jgi:hypothetical protein